MRRSEQGAGPLEAELRARADRLGLSGRVTFLANVEDVRPHLRLADFFVLSSDKEGFPLARLDAMACGIPSVVTDVGGIGEVVVHEETRRSSDVALLKNWREEFVIYR